MKNHNLKPEARDYELISLFPDGSQVTKVDTPRTDRQDFLKLLLEEFPPEEFKSRN
jgi:hypothetical protein